MDIRQLNYFVTLAETANFTRAAAKLHIAQPALSIAVKKFEEQLGIVLFDRNERRVSLTPEGEVLLRHARLILQSVHDATVAMEELKGLTKGEVKLGVPSSLGSYYLPDILMGFKSQYPNLKLTIVEAGTETIRRMLLDKELDLGIIHCDHIPDRLATEHLITTQMVAAVHPENELATRKTIDFRTFFEQDLVMFKPGYFHREYIDRICQENNFEPNIAFETNLLPMILKIVRNDFAVTALLDMVTDNESGVTPIPFEQPVILNIAIAWRKDGYLSVADKAFMEYVKNNRQL